MNENLGSSIPDALESIPALEYTKAQMLAQKLFVMNPRGVFSTNNDENMLLLEDFRTLFLVNSQTKTDDVIVSLLNGRFGLTEDKILFEGKEMSYVEYWNAQKKYARAFGVARWAVFTLIEFRNIIYIEETRGKSTTDENTYDPFMVETQRLNESRGALQMSLIAKFLNPANLADLNVALEVRKELSNLATNAAFVTKIGLVKHFAEKINNAIVLKSGATQVATQEQVVVDIKFPADYPFFPRNRPELVTGSESDRKVAEDGFVLFTDVSVKNAYIEIIQRTFDDFYANQKKKHAPQFSFVDIVNILTLPQKEFFGNPRIQTRKREAGRVRISILFPFQKAYIEFWKLIMRYDVMPTELLFRSGHFNVHAIRPYFTSVKKKVSKLLERSEKETFNKQFEEKSEKNYAQLVDRYYALAHEGKKTPLTVDMLYWVPEETTSSSSSTTSSSSAASSSSESSFSTPTNQGTKNKKTPSPTGDDPAEWAEFFAIHANHANEGQRSASDVFTDDFFANTGLDPQQLVFSDEDDTLGFFQSQIVSSFIKESKYGNFEKMQAIVNSTDPSFVSKLLIAKSPKGLTAADYAKRYGHKRVENYLAQLKK